MQRREGRRQGADDVGAVRVTSQASGSACVRRLRRQRGGQQRGGRRRGVLSGGARHAPGLSVMLGACGDGVGDVASGCGMGGGGASATAACGTRDWAVWIGACGGGVGGGASG